MDLNHGAPSSSSALSGSRISHPPGDGRVTRSKRTNPPAEVAAEQSLLFRRGARGTIRTRARITRRSVDKDHRHRAGNRLRESTTLCAGIPANCRRLSNVLPKVPCRDGLRLGSQPVAVPDLRAAITQNFVCNATKIRTGAKATTERTATVQCSV